MYYHYLLLKRGVVLYRSGGLLVEHSPSLLEIGDDHYKGLVRVTVQVGVAR